MGENMHMKHGQKHSVNAQGRNGHFMRGKKCA